MKLALALAVIAGPALGCTTQTFDLPEGDRMTLTLAPGVQVAVESRPDWLVFRSGAQELSVETHWDAGGASRLILTDIDGDGAHELWFGITFGMVNGFYDVLTLTPDGQMRIAWAEVSDPEFCTTETGFLGAVRSGPRWFKHHYLMDDGGVPYLARHQTLLDESAEWRVLFAPDGDITAMSIVPLGTDLFDDDAPPVTRRIFPGEGAVLYSDATLTDPMETLPHGDIVTLTGADEMSDAIRIEGRGLTGWVAAGDLID